MFLKHIWTIHWWELVLVYLHDLRKKKRAIYIRSDEQCVKGQEEAAASAEIMTRTSGVSFYRFGGWYC